MTSHYVMTSSLHFTSSLYVKTYVAIATIAIPKLIWVRLCQYYLPATLPFPSLSKRYASILHKFNNKIQNFNFLKSFLSDLATKLLVIHRAIVPPGQKSLNHRIAVKFRHLKRIPNWLLFMSVSFSWYQR